LLRSRSRCAGASRRSRTARSAGRIDPLLASLRDRLDGTRAVARVFEAAARAGRLPPGFSRKAFLEFVAAVVERGFLRIDARKD
jgi:hypothetical protein